MYFRPPVGSVVKNVYGEDTVRSINGVVTYIPNLYSGYEIKMDKPQRITMLTLCSNSLDKMIESIKLINQTLKVETSEGIFPVFCELTSEEILTAIH